MNERRILTIDGNEAVASVAYRTNEVIAIYPITPASAMGERADEWATQQKPNLGDLSPPLHRCSRKAEPPERSTALCRPAP